MGSISAIFDLFVKVSTGFQHRIHAGRSVYRQASVIASDHRTYGHYGPHGENNPNVSRGVFYRDQNMAA